MAKKPFVARKTRERKPKPTFIIGKQLNPQIGVAIEYQREIHQLILEEVVAPGLRKKGFVGDRITLAGLDLLRKKAFSIAKKFVSKVNRHSAKTTWDAIEELGKQHLTVGLAPAVEGLLAQQVETNVGLITNLAKETSDKITALYTKYGPDQSKIYPELQEMLGNRAKLIARDQNSKLFTSLNTARMLDSGIKTFIWDHSSAGKTPRKCHELRNGHEFSLEGGPEELKWPDGSDANQAFNAKKGDLGKPGYAINCRCRMRPKASLDD